jgi:uncharacterized protein DUF6166
MGSSYEGERGPKGLLVYVVESGAGGTKIRPLSPRIDLVKHTPTGGFECGFKGSGPSQLALALLADHLGDDEALELHLAFRDRVILELPRDRGWSLTKGYIDAHLKELRASRAVQEPTAPEHA